MNTNRSTILVIFGVTGDLMARKIVPALYNLFLKKKLPLKFRVIGFGRRDLNNASFSAHVEKILQGHSLFTRPRASPRSFLRLFSYVRSLFDDRAGYDQLQKEMDMIDAKWNTCANKLFYLAVPPELYELIFTNLAASGLGRSRERERSETRILVEKPFGKDLKTAEDLDKALSHLFEEEQIYRIDHYLAKEMVQNILTFRFANNLFQKNWSNETVEKIEIKLLEKIGVEARGAFYDNVGALRDVGQNHLLQVLALITMKHPGGFHDEAIRGRRAEVLSTLVPLQKKEVKNFTFRAQYRGYEKIQGVQSGSETETYFKIRAFLSHPSWQGVPIYLESGKKLKHQIKEVVVTFRHPTPCLCPTGGREHYKNKVIISLEPEEGIRIQFWSKKPGLEMRLEERNFDFFLRKEREKVQYIEEYEKLLLDCFNGDQTLFVRTDEVKAMWRFTDSIIHAWEKNLALLRAYTPGEDKVIFRAAEALRSRDGQRKQREKKLGLIGLGKMGSNVARRLHDYEWNVHVFNRTHEKARELEEEGVGRAFSSIESLVLSLSRPRIVWVMLTAGKAVQDAIDELVKFLDPGDVVIDGGNSFYKDSVRRGRMLEKKGIDFLDVGVSGGPGGARSGACCMIGGRQKVFLGLEFLFRDIAQENGYQFFEGYGAGHFVKMVHNGIEYGMMQAIAEGFSVLKKAKYKFDLTRVADVYNHGSVIESRLVSWLWSGFRMYGEDLKAVSGKVEHTGEGMWTVQTAKEMGLQAKIIEGALCFRIQSEKKPSYAGKILTTLRNQFGGHSIT